jgi:hypothetical protein
MIGNPLKSCTKPHISVVLSSARIGQHPLLHARAALGSLLNLQHLQQLSTPSHTSTSQSNSKHITIMLVLATAAATPAAQCSAV